MRFAIDMLSRKNRPAARTSRRGAVSRAMIERAATAGLEFLEPRRLMASVAGGQIGVFQGPTGTPVRITVTGSGSLDFVGATRDAFGNPRMNDIPMTVFDANGNVVRENLGGYAGRRGEKLANDVVGDGTNDSEFVGPSRPYTNVPSGSVNLDGLAANFLGKTYGVNRYSNNGVINVDILRVDSTSANVQRDAEVSDAMLAQMQTVNPLFRKSDILSIIGADFPPTDANLLYFAANLNFPVSDGASPPSITRTATPAMFTYNLQTKQVLIDGTLFGVNLPDDAIRIDDFTFLDNGQIAMFGSVKKGLNGTAQEGLFFSDADAVVPDNYTPVRIGEQLPNQPPPPLTTSLAAIEAIPGEDYILAVTSAAGVGTTTDADTAQLVKIELHSDGNGIPGRGLVIGSVVDPDEDTQITLRTGESIRDLAWNPRITDHYFQPGKRGVLLGAEGNYDQLLALDIRERFQNTDLYAVFGQDVRPDTSVSIAEYTPDGRQQLSFNQKQFLGIANPFGGSAGVLQTNMTPGDPVNLNLGNGGLYLGIRRPDRDDVISIPVLGLSSKDDFEGGKPGVVLPKTVRPGVYISGTMRSFYFGGTITGSVNIDGSIDTFYAGNVVTGDPLNGRVNGNDNFFVNGDMRNLVVSGGLGTLAGANDDLYHPQTDFLINGRVQAIKTGSEFRGSIDIGGKTSEQTIGSAVSELEFTPNLNTVNRVGLAFAAKLDTNGDNFVDENDDIEIVNGITRNDSFNTPQVLGSYYSKNRKRGGQVTVNGTINNGPNFGDQDDYYGVSLLAGQTVQVKAATTNISALTSGLSDSLVTLSIVDPEGRVYMTDQSNINPVDFINQTVQFTADKPGLWRLEVSAYTPGVGGVDRVDLDRPYSLTVDKIGELGLGGLVAAGNAYFDRPDLGLRVRNADLGAIFAGGQVESDNSFGGPGFRGAIDQITGRDTIVNNPIESTNGNIRSVTGSGIAFFDDAANTLGRFPHFVAPKGSIGLIHGNQYVYFNVYSLSVTGGTPSGASVVGGDVQVIESPGTGANNGDVDFNLTVNGSIGVIRAQSFGQGPDTTTNGDITTLLLPPIAGYIGINQDGKGTADLGLIDIEGNFGTFQQGGPTINVGDGGNARYMRLGGLVYRRALAGTGGVTVLTGVDKAVSLLDDSGATVTLAPYNGVAVTSNATAGTDTTPGAGIPDPFGGNGDPSIDGTNGIPDPFGGNGNPSTNGSSIPNPFGGVTPVPGATPQSPPVTDIVGTLQVSAYPVQSGGFIIYDVSSTTGISASSSNGTADLTTLEFVGDITRPATPRLINPAAKVDEVRQSPSVVAPLELGTGTTQDFVATGDRVNVYELITESALQADFTRILNETDGEVVNVSARDVAYINAELIGTSRPVNGVKIEPLAAAVVGLPGQAKTGLVVSNAIDIRSRGAVGNITVLDGPGIGVLQNLEANADNVNTKGVFEGINGPIDVTGYLRRVDIGEGLATSGSGDVVFSGIFVHDDGTDSPAFIDGSLGLVTNENGGGDLVGDIIVDTYIAGITLTGGASIFNADIYQLASITNAINVAGGFGTERVAYGLDQVFGSTDNSILEGMGDIKIAGNGGIISSRIVGYNMGRIITDKTSFGMVSSQVESSSGATMGGTDIGGLGIRSSLYSGGSFVGKVKVSGVGKVLDVKNFSRTARLDEFGYFDPATGIAPNASIDINLAIGTSKKLSKIDGVTNAGVIQDSEILSARTLSGVSAYEIRGVNTGGARPRDDLYPMQITASNSIGDITTIRNINGLRVVGGAVGTITAGRDITQFQLTANQRVKGIVAGRNILGTANFNLTNNGSLDLLQAGGNVNGTGFAAKGIRSIIVKGNLGTARSQGGIHSGADINVLQVSGNISGTALIRADKMIKTLILEGDLEANAAVRATSFGTQKIDGTVFGQIITG